MVLCSTPWHKCVIYLGSPCAFLSWRGPSLCCVISTTMVILWSSFALWSSGLVCKLLVRPMCDDFAPYTPCLSVLMLQFKVWSLGVDLSFDLRQSTSSGLSFCCFRLRQVSRKPRQAQTHIHTHTNLAESKKLLNVKGGRGG